jgi:ubiquinone biosynthesis protein
MKTRTELVMLQKTMVVVEGVGRTLDPHLDMWRTAEPVVRDWITRNLGPLGRIEDAGRGARSAILALTSLPETIGRVQGVISQLEEAGRSGFTLDTASIRAMGKAQAHGNRWIARALWVIVAVLVWMALY